MEEQIRTLRLEIDKLINSTYRLNNSAEITLCMRQLQRAKAWLGMVLGGLGTPTPYGSSTDPSSPVIEEQAEHKFETIWDGIDVSSATQTSCVKLFRKEIEEFLSRFDRVFPASEMYDIPGVWTENHLIFSRCSMIEAKHWLGWELNRIKNVKEYEKSVEGGTVVSSPGFQPMPL